MTYASDLGLVVGSKIKYLSDDSLGTHPTFIYNDILTLVDDTYGNAAPKFENDEGEQEYFDLSKRLWEHYKEEEVTVKHEYKIGDKVEIIHDGIFGDSINVGDIATITNDYNDYLILSCPSWGGTQRVYKQYANEYANKYIKPYVAAIPKTPFEQAGYTKETKFKCLCDYGKFSKGDVVTLYDDDGTISPKFINSKGDTHYMILPTCDERELEVHVEDKATLFPVGTEVQIAKDSVWYCGNELSSNPKDIKGVITSNTHGTVAGDGFVHCVKWSNGHTNSYKLNDLVLWNDDTSVASQEAITERLEDKPSVSIGLGKDASSGTTEPVYKVGDSVVITDLDVFNKYFVKLGDVATIVEIDCAGDLTLSCESWGYNQDCFQQNVSPVNGVGLSSAPAITPLIVVEPDVSYKVTIKGTPFTFTQDELNQLTEELLGFSDDF